MTIYILNDFFCLQKVRKNSPFNWFFRLLIKKVIISAHEKKVLRATRIGQKTGQNMRFLGFFISEIHKNKKSIVPSIVLLGVTNFSFL